MKKVNLLNDEYSMRLPIIPLCIKLKLYKSVYSSAFPQTQNHNSVLSNSGSVNKWESMVKPLSEIKWGHLSQYFTKSTINKRCL